MKGRIARDVIVSAVAVLISLSSARGAIIHKDIGELTTESNRIVIGDVAEVTSFWNQDHTLIKSRIVVDVDDYIIGEGTGTETLEMSGGTVDDLTLRVSVLPIFEVGDHVLLFLGDSEIDLVGFFQGAYLTDGEQVARMGAGCRQVLSETLRPLSGLLSEIEQSLPAGASLPEVSPYDGDFDILLYVLCGRDWTYQSDPMGESYKINANCQDGQAGDANSQRTQIQNGANVWNDAGADFEFTYGGTSTQTYVQYNGTNLVYFDTTPPDGGGYLAATYSWFNGNNILECDVVFDDQHWVWWNGSGGCYGYFDIWSVAAHEFGHFLCLGHSGFYWATMYYAIGSCETHPRTLYFDDIDGIMAIYGTEDITPPEPDPMSFQSPPSAMSTSAITMTATLATDDTPPVHYQFDFVAGGPGGSDRTWGSTRTYIDYSLTQNTEYSYRCRARDGASPPNETAYSSVMRVFTLANVPGAPALSNVTSNSIDLDVDPNENPGNTPFAVLCATSDPAWDGMFVNASGDPAVSEEWQTDGQWGTVTVLGLTPETEYSFQVKALNGDGIETEYGPQGTETTLPDLEDITPPEPDPMTFESPPSAASTSAIIMTATLATDDTPPVEYQFDFVAGGPGGSDRSWEPTRIYTDYSLTQNTEYSYRCRARDGASPPNETQYSSVLSAFTLANIPGAPALSNVTSNSIDLDVDANENPGNTPFAVLCATSDPAWDGMFVNASGDPAVSEEWQTDDQWGTVTVLGLNPETEYSFQVKARNGDGIETEYGPQGTETTLPEAVVPTLTEWGMIIMALLLLATGTIAVIRRRSKIVARTF
jgi:hypothetical protein